MKTAPTAPTTTLNLASVKVAFEGRVITTRGLPAEFDSMTLKTDAKARVAFLKNAASFVLESNTKVSRFKSAIRLSISKPNDSSLAVAANAARIGIEAIRAVESSIAEMYLAVPSLAGQEIAKDDNGDSITGNHLATVMFGAETSAAARAALKQIER